MDNHKTCQCHDFPYSPATTVRSEGTKPKQQCDAVSTCVSSRMEPPQVWNHPVKKDLCEEYRVEQKTRSEVEWIQFVKFPLWLRY